ncbi:putative alcohol dehydrogenase [Fusarium denticulatum]|uniref:Putative alcohol dehydrogenase n=1 Tax=Fusarium denticulatum TaxID=48507 RepID=A0A8H5UJW9_9HYPO|nr:putative alcohol dehydrogenase [Fusarium denticulatum]
MGKKRVLATREERLRLPTTENCSKGVTSAWPDLGPHQSCLAELRDGIVSIGTYPFPGPDALVPGSDGAGVVEALGEGVTEWKVGDRVVTNFTQEHIAGRLTRDVGLTQLGGEAQGLLGEYFIFPKTGVVKIPDYLSLEEASCLPCAALTAWNALYGLTPLRPGQTVLLQGTGGVSTFALQIAHAAGAKTIVTSSSDDKLAKAKYLGATYGINYSKTPDWAAEAMRITNGKGVDHIIEIGGTLTLQASFDAIGFNGQIHCIGHITNPDPLGAGKDLRGPDAAFLALDRLCVVRGVVVGSREQLQDMLECFEANDIRSVIDRVFSFENAREAYNSFLSDFLPLAMESPALAEALIAYSSGHMSHSDPSYTTVSLAARSRALCELSTTISRPDQAASVTESALSASLIPLTSEVCLESHQSWYNHLVGAQHLIASAQRQADGSLVLGARALRLTSEGRWILRNFAYHDIIGSVTLGTKPLLCPDYLGDITHEFDMYLGVASQILVYIGQITCLDLSTTDVEIGIRPSRNYLGIQYKLESWTCPAGTPPTLEAAACAYRGAALIYLYRKMRRQLEADHNFSLACGMSLNTLNDKLQTIVEDTLDSIGQVHENHVSESSLLFPLFIVGGEVERTDQMEFVRARLQVSCNKRRCRNISRALEVLEELWVYRQIQDVLGGNRPDWEYILKSGLEPLLLT